MISKSFLFEFNKLSGLILESRKDIIINKIGLPDRLADIIEQRYGKYAIWVADSFKKHLLETSARSPISFYDSKTEELRIATKDVINKLGNLNDNIFLDGTYNYEDLEKALNKIWFSGDVGTESKQGAYDYIYDWLRGRSSGPVIDNEKLDFKTLSLIEAIRKAVVWHKELERVSSGRIKDEEGDIIKTYPDGFYWIRLNASSCDKEAKAMGHCGRGSGILYSLRKDKYPYVTADIDNGAVLQMRGRANSKPSSKYHPYIFDFILSDVVSSFDYNTYRPEDNFHLNDLEKKEIDIALKQKPELFKNQNLNNLDDNQIDYLTEIMPEAIQVNVMFSDIKNLDKIKQDISDKKWWDKQIKLIGFEDIIESFYNSGNKYFRLLEDVLKNNKNNITDYLFLTENHTLNIKRLYDLKKYSEIELTEDLFLNTNRALFNYVKNKTLNVYINYMVHLSNVKEEEKWAKKAFKLLKNQKIKELYIKEKGKDFYDVVFKILSRTF